MTEAERRLQDQLQEAVDFIEEVGRDLLHRRIADWYPEGAGSAALAMSEDMRLIGNRCVEFEPSAPEPAAPPSKGALPNCACGNQYLAIRTDIYKDGREFVYCDCCGALATRVMWERQALLPPRLDAAEVAKHVARLEASTFKDDQRAAELLRAAAVNAE